MDPDSGRIGGYPETTRYTASTAAAVSKDATSAREHHLGFNTRVIVVLSIDITENLECPLPVQWAGATRRTPSSSFIFRASFEI
jgi:hypothetical protein